MAYFAGKD